jgi:hypothetical protein
VRTARRVAARDGRSRRPLAHVGVRACCWLVQTHYLHLANLRNLYPSHVKTLVLAVEPCAHRLRFLYAVREGVAHKRQYMTDFLAQIAGVPADVCATARTLSAAIDFDPVDKPSARTKTLEAYAHVAERLVWTRRSTLDEQCRHRPHASPSALEQPITHRRTCPAQRAPSRVPPTDGARRHPRRNGTCAADLVAFSACATCSQRCAPS